MVAYQRKSARQAWNAGHMAAAISAYKDGNKTYRQCEELFGIPRSTLERRVNDKNKFAVGAKTRYPRLSIRTPENTSKSCVPETMVHGFPSNTYIFEGQNSAAAVTNVKSLCSNQETLTFSVNHTDTCTSEANQETTSPSGTNQEAPTSNASQEASTSGANQRLTHENKVLRKSVLELKQLLKANKIPIDSIPKVKKANKMLKYDDQISSSNSARKSSLKVDSDAHAINIEILENGQFHIVRFADRSLNFYKYYVGYIIDVDHSIQFQM